MRRTLAVLIAALAVLAAVPTPAATAGDAPIGRIGETLRVDFFDEMFGRIVADVTVHDVLPVDPPPPGYTPTGSPRWKFEGGPWRAPVTVRAIDVPNPFAMAVAFSFDGVTPYADAYAAKNTDAPNDLRNVLRNVPKGATVNGDVYWQVYRGLVTNVTLLNPKTGTRLAQWNLWEPGAPLP